MIIEIGHFTLALALFITLVEAPILFASARGRAIHAAGDIVEFARRASLLVAALVSISFLSLLHSFAVSDFSVYTVFENSHSAKPLIYKITGAWGNHEGSILLWLFILTLYSGALAYGSRQLPRDLAVLTLGVQALVIAAFISFILFTSNPFARLNPAAPDGQGLNPLLQDIGLAIHPPFLYLGYVGFSVPFSFAVAALIRGRADTIWAALARPWALASWTFLTIGITLGSWWAYYELGWGGWWAWDPVENASFMPWLAGTALIHSLRVVEKRDAFKGWAVLLAISTFSLSLVGTFLVRSGIITSVHAFATDPTRGVFILMILGAVVGGSLTLYALRADRLVPTGAFAAVSRESFLVANNALLVASCATVFLGTFYPLFVDIISGERLSVGAPYFNAVFSPIALLTLGLAAIGGLAPWRQAKPETLRRRLRPAAAAAGAALLIVLLLADRARLIGAVSIGIAAWLAASAVTDILGRITGGRGAKALTMRRVANASRSAWGASLAHLGLAVFAIGATSLSLWKREEIVRMQPGEIASIAGYSVTLDAVDRLRGPNYESERAIFSAQKHGDEFELAGERRFYPIRGMQTTEAAIAPQVNGDLYITFGENASGTGWPVRLHFNPLVNFLWIGAGLSALGGALALSDRAKSPKLRRAPTQPTFGGAVQAEPAE
ncbi:MAG: heme lyase CcmF/NrfE family subunit [Pseudomonadota bacterium]